MSKKRFSSFILNNPIDVYTASIVTVKNGKEFVEENVEGFLINLDSWKKYDPDYNSDLCPSFFIPLSTFCDGKHNWKSIRDSIDILFGQYLGNGKDSRLCTQPFLISDEKTQKDGIYYDKLKKSDYLPWTYPSAKAAVKAYCKQNKENASYTLISGFDKSGKNKGLYLECTTRGGGCVYVPLSRACKLEDFYHLGQMEKAGFVGFSHGQIISDNCDSVIDPESVRVICSENMNGLENARKEARRLVRTLSRYSTVNPDTDLEDF